MLFWSACVRMSMWISSIIYIVWFIEADDILLVMPKIFQYQVGLTYIIF